MQALEAIINGIFIGPVTTPWSDKAPSAINKHRIDRAVFLTPTGFDGDAQADPRVHGGLEKAVHHYAADHYDCWRARYGDNRTFQPGGFGENISTEGLSEQMLCIGDVLQLGQARVQVSQGRQPCWKLNAHTGIEEMARQFQATAQTGWYYRVLETGTVTVGERIVLLERPNPAWSVERVLRARLNPRTNLEVAKVLSQLTGLAEGWRKAFEKKSSRDFREDVSKRLGL